MIKRSAFLVCSALLFGLPIAQTTPRAPFEEDIEKFEAADRMHPPIKHGIVFVGSSSIRFWKTLKDDFPGYHVINRGFGGSQVSDSTYFAHRIVTPYEPQMIVFFAGTNDLAAGKSPETVLADYQAFVRKVREKQRRVPIIYISVTPAPSRWKQIDKVRKTNELIAAYCKRERGLKFMDVFRKMLSKDGGPRPELFVADQLHMNSEGYKIWVEALTPLLPKIK